MTVNDGMPEWVASRAARILNRAGKATMGSRVLVLGVAYKQDIDDYRESPALRVIERLEERGAEVSYYDPGCRAAGTRRRARIHPGPVGRGYRLATWFW